MEHIIILKEEEFLYLASIYGIKEALSVKQNTFIRDSKYTLVSLLSQGILQLTDDYEKSVEEGKKPTLQVTNPFAQIFRDMKEATHTMVVTSSDGKGSCFYLSNKQIICFEYCDENRIRLAQIMDPAEETLTLFEEDEKAVVMEKLMEALEEREYLPELMEDEEIQAMHSMSDIQEDIENNKRTPMVTLTYYKGKELLGIQDVFRSGVSFVIRYSAREDIGYRFYTKEEVIQTFKEIEQ